MPYEFRDGGNWDRSVWFCCWASLENGGELFSLVATDAECTVDEKTTVNDNKTMASFVVERTIDDRKESDIGFRFLLLLE